MYMYTHKIICNVYFNKLYIFMFKVFNGKISGQCCNHLFAMISFLLWDFPYFDSLSLAHF